MTQLEEAYNEDLEGRVCHFCSKENDFADDLGYFYILDPNKDDDKIYPACNKCYNQHSHYHIRKYGLGER